MFANVGALWDANALLIATFAFKVPLGFLSSTRLPFLNLDMAAAKVDSSSSGSDYSSDTSSSGGTETTEVSRKGPARAAAAKELGTLQSALEGWQPPNGLPAGMHATMMSQAQGIGGATDASQAIGQMMARGGLAADIQEQNEEDEAHPIDEKIHDYIDALKGQVIGSRHKLGVEMMKQLTPEEFARYKTLKKHTELNSFRLEWVDKKLKAAEAEREKTRTWTKREETVGKFLPFGMIVKAEGGWRDLSAIRAALTRVSKCLAMGEGWVQWNKMTDRLEFKFTRSRHIEAFERAWRERAQMNAAKPKLQDAARDLANQGQSSAAVARSQSENKYESDSNLYLSNINYVPNQIHIKSANVS
jgi:hypothetical protein